MRGPPMAEWSAERGRLVYQSQSGYYASIEGTNVRDVQRAMVVAWLSDAVRARHSKDVANLMRVLAAIDGLAIAPKTSPEVNDGLTSSAAGPTPTRGARS